MYASYSTLVADISNLDDPATWTVTDHTCAVSAQYHPVYGPAAEQRPATTWCATRCPTSAPGTRSCVALSPMAVLRRTPTAAGSTSGTNCPRTTGTPRSTTPPCESWTSPKETPRILAQIEGPGHSVDWFRTADGREFLLHANEIAVAQTSCVPHPRTSAVGFTHQAYLTEVTGDMLEAGVDGGDGDQQAREL